MADQPELILRHIHKLVGNEAIEQLSDAQLLQRFALRRDEAAFAGLVQRHGAAVLGVCRRLLRHTQNAEDVFQATFLVLARKAGSVRKGQSVGSFLYGVAWRLARKARADEARQRRRPPPQEPVADDPLAALSARELQQALDEELARLPERYLAPVTLCYLHGHTQEEAAAELGWSKATLRRRLDRARRLLQARLIGRGLTAPAAALTAALASVGTGTAVSPALVEGTARIIHQFLSGEGAAPSAATIALADHAVRLLAGSRFKAMAALALSTGLLVVTAGMVARQPIGPADQRKELVTGATVPGPAARRDLLGDPLPPGALARLGSLRFRVSGGWLGFSPDGKTLGVGEDLWDPATGARLRSLPLPPHRPFGAYSPDFRLMAAWGGEKPLQMWDVATGEERQILKGDTAWTSVAAFSRNGRRLVTARAAPEESDRWIIQVWDLDRGRALAVLKHDSFNEPMLDLSSEGTKLASVEWHATRSLHLIDVATGKDIPPYPVPLKQEDGRSGRGVAFSPDDKRLVAMGYLLDVAAAQPLGGLPDLWGPLSWSPDSTTLPSGPRLIDVTTGRARPLETVHQSVGNALFSPDGKQLVGIVPGGTLYVWDAASGKQLNSLTGHESSVVGVSLSRDGSSLASISLDGTLRLWDARTGREQHCHKLTDPFGRHFVHQNRPPMARSPDDALLTIGSENAISLRDAATGKELRRLEGHRAPVCTLAFSPDGKTLASGSQDRTVRLWDLASGRTVGQLEGHRGDVYCLAFAPDGKTLATGGEDHALCLWDVASRRELRLVGWQEAPVRFLAFSSDGQTIAAINTGHSSPYSTSPVVRLWDPATGRERGRLDSNLGGLSAMAFSPDGRILATNGREGLECWDVVNRKVIRTLPASGVMALDFSADGRRLATGSGDTTILIWDADELKRP